MIEVLPYCFANASLCDNNFSSADIRRRNREEKKKNTAALIEKMKAKQRESEVFKKRRSRVKPYIIGLSLALFVGGVLIYKYYWNG